jgi:hypothetical protein
MITRILIAAAHSIGYSAIAAFAAKRTPQFKGR